MKKILLAFLLLTLIWQCSAEILIYDCTTTGEGGGGGGSSKFAVPEKMFYDLPTTNWILVSCNRKARNISVSYSSNCVAVTIQGSGSQTFTAFGFLPPGGLSPGQGIFEMIGFPGAGQNESLKIDGTNSVTFPRVLSNESSSVSFGGSAAPSFSMASQKSVFSTAATQSANRQGQSINDAANALIQSLQAAGFSGP